MSEFRQMSALRWVPEAKLAQLMESLPYRHALILFKNIVPCLRHATKVVEGQPHAIGGEGALPPKKLLTLVEQSTAPS